MFGVLPYRSVEFRWLNVFMIYKSTLLDIFGDIIAMNVWTGVQTRIVNNTYCYSYHLCDAIYWCHRRHAFSTLISIRRHSRTHSHSHFSTIHSSKIAILLILSSPVSLAPLLRVPDKIFITRIPNKIINSINIVWRWHNLWLWTFCSLSMRGHTKFSSGIHYVF